jgi:hypothetical protein
MINYLKLSTPLVFVFITLVSYASPCNKYKFTLCNGNNSIIAVYSNLTVRWSINTGFRNCGFKKEEIKGKKFIISIKNIFEEVLIKDTIDVNFYHINQNLVKKSDFIIFNFQELGAKEQYNELVIKFQNKELPKASTKIDSLNNYLLNGYFLNALSILKELENDNLLNDILKQFDLLFPDHYPYNLDFFNSYVKESDSSLVSMPYVDGFDEFYSSLNKEKIKEKSGFVIKLRVAPNNEVSEIEVVPLANKEIAVKNLHFLKFQNRRNEVAEVIVKIGTNRKGNRYEIVNERALIDPDSKGFQKTFPFLGALH